LEELSPAKTANELFGAHKTNLRKIAIATRNANDPTTQQYVQALLLSSTTSKSSNNTSSSFDRVRVFTNHSAVQDFCAMRHATELVGTVRSTFVVWAALLGGKDSNDHNNNNKIARLYSVDSQMGRKRAIKKNAPIFRYYNWTHPELKRRIHFELYRAEDVE
jgi:hypothetical protein